jgi:hypothetical protein
MTTERHGTLSSARTPGLGRDELEDDATITPRARTGRENEEAWPMGRRQKQGNRAQPQQWRDAMVDDPAVHPDVVRAHLAEVLCRLMMQDEHPWQHCPASACRRRRACVAPGVPCYEPPPPGPPLTPEERRQQDADVAAFRDAIRARVEASQREEQE